MPPLKDCRNEELTSPVKGKALVIRHVLSVQVKEYDVDQQRETCSTLVVISETRFVV